MPASIQRVKLLSQFSCLGDKCEDTCCHGWSMQVDDPTLARYRAEAPELLGAVESGGLEATTIMRKNSGTGYCVKLEGGLCGIHKKFGDRFLGDACYFYPRATRTLGDTVLMTATASCPEIARLMFSVEDALILESAAVDRLPYALKNYLPEELTAEQALATHQIFLSAADDTSVSPERIFSRIASASRSLDNSRMLSMFLEGLAKHLAPGGEGWLLMSDLAERLGLRAEGELEERIAAAGLRVVGRDQARPRHRRSRDREDPLAVARGAEIVSLWRLAPAGEEARANQAA